MSMISSIKVSPSTTSIKDDEIIDFEVSFKVEGEIRDKFNQETWTYAYDKHDNLFRIKYTIGLDYDKGVLAEPVTLIRKASFYWSRDPKIPPYPPEKKIWAMIVIQESPVIPTSIEHAKSLLFDVKYSIIASGSRLSKGINNVNAYAIVEWGKHVFISDAKIVARSEPIRISKI